MKEKRSLGSMICDLCGYVYFPEIGDEKSGVKPGTSFKEVPESWVCPVCTSHKSDFFSDAAPEVNSQATENLSLWERYVKAYEVGEQTPIPDFSYAGYRHGNELIPEASGKVFSVVDYGARKDASEDAQEAIQKTIHAAEAQGGGIVFFPAGRYLVNGTEGNRKSIVISKANITLKGEGQNKSVIFMKHHMVAHDPNYMWLVPPMFLFSNQTDSPGSFLSKITEDVERGSFEIEVDDESHIKVGEVVALYNRSTNATSEFLNYRTPWPIWDSTIKKGPLTIEKHTVKAVVGNRILFNEPIFCTVRSGNCWELWSQSMTADWRMEDLCLEGNWQEKIVHHKNYIHDSGWTMVEMIRGLNPIVTRVRFLNVNACVNFVGCMNATGSEIVLEGNAGHCSVQASSGSYGTLLTRIVDKTNDGSWHGPGSSKSSCGTVIHRCVGKERGGPDFHASWPYGTLVDSCHCGLIGTGGSYRLLPNHGPFLIWWNHRHVGAPLVNYNFWEERKDQEFYSGPKVSGAWMVGYHGAEKNSFVEKSLSYSESHGQPVEIGSLYEAQLALRKKSSRPISSTTARD
jgi:rubredoxin